MASISQDHIELSRSLQTLENMIVHGQNEFGDVTVFPFVVLEFTQAPKLDLFQKAVEYIVHRHPNLRSVITENKNFKNKLDHFTFHILKPNHALKSFEYFHHVRTEKLDTQIVEKLMCKTIGVGFDKPQFQVNDLYVRLPIYL